MHTVKQRVKLIVEPVSESAFATALSDAEIGKMRGTQERRILALYDVKKCGESITAPHLRTAPLRKDHCQKAVRAFLQSRGSMEMHEHDLLFFMDAGKHGSFVACQGSQFGRTNQNLAASCFKFWKNKPKLGSCVLQVLEEQTKTWKLHAPSFGRTASNVLCCQECVCVLNLVSLVWQATIEFSAACLSRMRTNASSMRSGPFSCPILKSLFAHGEGLCEGLAAFIRSAGVMFHMLQHVPRR